jgi:hypothetical protein
MARAGYDPEEAVKFWQRFAEYNEKAGAIPSGSCARIRWMRTGSGSCRNGCRKPKRSIGRRSD